MKKMKSFEFNVRELAGSIGNAPKGEGNISVKRLFWLLMIGALISYFLGFRLPEEKRNRALKLMREGLEMPFRLFV
ncbi:MAG: hypothetical protein KKH73_04590 [Actinobacteria bacterium]|nr:hypothetical protein [Actinomycetota bacterium]